MGTTAQRTAAARTERAASIDQDLRFTELVARAGIEPELTARYGEDPFAALAGLGLLPGAAAGSGARSLVIEDLDAPADPPSIVCWRSGGPEARGLVIEDLAAPAGDAPIVCWRTQADPAEQAAASGVRPAGWFLA
ncbi:hypothetical protein ACIQGZ_18900 [Streptomyces sp. NPDC092296]|uniref:hypothetical protein n=1 Tax=Streptomyces sp. NPDC092296 TaxID=3366012 RepID=UPI00381B421C